MTSASEQENPVLREEKLAREQLGLDDNWKLVTLASAVPVGLEDQIAELNNDEELSSSRRNLGCFSSESSRCGQGRSLALLLP